MKVIECPNTFLSVGQTSLFLGGGISRCPDWQADMIRRLQHVDDRNSELLLINPRRHNFNIDDAETTRFQISWEYQHIKRSSAMLFWFPSETLCPITLYELGAMSATNKPIFVGCHPSYVRKLDVEVQMSLSRPEVRVVDSLSDLAASVIDWNDNLQRMLDK